MAQSETIGKIAEALSKAQAKYNTLIKDSCNPFFKSRYADLAACIDATRDALLENGIAVSQATCLVNDKMVLETKLLHISGEWLSGQYLVTPTKMEPQPVGAAITYARRYSLCGMLGIAQEDDDGETAHGRGKTKHNGTNAEESPKVNPEKDTLPF